MSRSTTLKFLFVGLLAFGLIAYQIFKPEDPCNKPSSKYLFLIDRTDFLGPKTQDGIKNALNKLIEEAEPGTLIKLTYVTGDERSDETVSACRPRMLTRTTTIHTKKGEVQGRWDEFQKKIDTKLNEKQSPSPSSPIYETVLNEARTEFQAFSGKKLIAVFSDYRQHTSKVSLHHRCGDIDMEFNRLVDSLPLERTKLQGKAQPLAPLSAAEIHPYFIPRDDMNREFMSCVTAIADRFFNKTADGKSTLNEMKWLAQSGAVSK